MRSGRPPTLWCDLIVTEGPPVNETLSITSGIERALREEIRRRAALGELLRLRLERLDEEPPDRLPLRLRVGDAVERGEESLRRVDMDERDVVVAAEERHDLLRLVLPHQPVVDEDAGELVADRLVDQHRRDRGIDAAGEAADHPPVAHLRRGCVRSPRRGTAPSSSRPRGRRCCGRNWRGALRRPACAPPPGGTSARR